MISRKEYLKYPEIYWKGRRVRALYNLTSGSQSVQKGTILTIKAKASGFTLETPRCPHCGVAVFIRKVESTAVELVD